MLRQEGEQVHVVLCGMDPTELMEMTQELNNHHQIKVVGFALNGNDAVEKTASLAADVLLTDYSMPDMSAIEMKKELAEQSPGTAVFVISDSLSEQLIRTAKSAGIAELFLRETLSLREVGNKIVNYVDELRKEWSEASRLHGRIEKGTGPKGEKVRTEYVTKTLKQAIILTHNTKGGVGKSTVAVNLATSIKMSPYYSGQRVCLVDFDCGSANVAVNAHIPDAQVLNRNLAMWASIPENVGAKEVDELLIEGPQGIMIGAAPINQAVAKNINYDLADKILKILRKHFSVIVIDGAPNISDIIDSAFEHSTHILMVSTPEGQSVKQLSKIVNLFTPEPDNDYIMDYSHILRKMFLVLNHINPPTAYDLGKSDIVDIVGRPLFAEIPYDEVVLRAMHSPAGKVAVELEPDSPFSLAIKSLANYICSAYPEIGSEKKKLKQKDKHRTGIFSRLLGFAGRR